VKPGDHPIGELAPPTRPKPGERRAGGVMVHALAPGLGARLVEVHGPLDAVAQAFMLGQRVGAGRIGGLLGCTGRGGCGGKSVAVVDGARVCLLCGAGGAS
jgi:hypothetical protein